VQEAGTQPVPLGLPSPAQEPRSRGVEGRAGHGLSTQSVRVSRGFGVGRSGDPRNAQLAYSPTDTRCMDGMHLDDLVEFSGPKGAVQGWPIPGERGVIFHLGDGTAQVVWERSSLVVAWPLDWLKQARGVLHPG
jgi:hypothetical protein